MPRSRRAPSAPRLLCPAQLRRNRLIVLELLPRPFFEIDLCRRTRFARALTTLIRRRVWYRARFAARLVSLANALGLWTARGGNCDKSPIDKKVPDPETLRHFLIPLALNGRCQRPSEHGLRQSIVKSERCSRRMRDTFQSLDHQHYLSAAALEPWGGRGLVLVQRSAALRQR